MSDIFVYKQFLCLSVCLSSPKTARPRNINDCKNYGPVIAVVLGLVLGYRPSPGRQTTFQEATTGTDSPLNLFEAPLSASFLSSFCAIQLFLGYVQSGFNVGLILCLSSITLFPTVLN